MPKYKEGVETTLAKIVVDGEYQIAKTNQSNDFSDFESYIDLFDAERTEKNYDWNSDIFIPEFPTHMLTQSAIDVSQYFQTRDYVEVYYEDTDPKGMASAQATKELINRTLNRRELHHYPKFVRAKTINHLIGHVDLKCWWEQKLETEYDVNTFGDIVGEEDVPVKDHFNYEVLDPRNVFTDSKYAYSMQQRDWVIIRCEKDLNRLKSEKDQFGYFNLDLLEKEHPVKSDEGTETARETIESDDGQKLLPDNKLGGKYDILERYGKWWVVDDKDGNAKPGINKEGHVLKGAYQAEVVMSFAVNKSSKTLIQFHHTPYIDAYGFTYRPLIRGLCYIHPTKDAGVGDGKYTRELQIAINDTFNVGADRTLLATLPTLKGKKYATEDSDTIRIEPDHMMELNDPDDVKELIISDDIQGAMTQLAMLYGKFSQATAIWPTTMGGVPEDSSTTATAVAGAEGRTNQRTNYKSMTFEYTALTELYWMIQQMTWTFARPETGVRLMGEDKVFNFNPTLDYTYKPVSASIESEHSKALKVKNWTQILSYVINVGHPQIGVLINHIITKISELMGDEFADFAHALLDPRLPVQTGNESSAQASGAPTQNQYGNAQPPTEQGARALF